MKDFGTEKNPIKLQYGLQNGKIIHISEISDNERGLKCNCLCPCCKDPLQAKIGFGKRQAHFAHSAAECKIEVANQTALHLLAKEILEEEKKIWLPELIASNQEQYENIDDETMDLLNQEMKIMPVYQISIDKVILEQRFENVIPDILIVTNDRKLFVEIAVTHFIDYVKEDKLRAINITTLEIDLSEYHNNSNWDREILTDIIVNGVSTKKWIYHRYQSIGTEKIAERNRGILEKYYDKKRLEIEKQNRIREENRKKEKAKENFKKEAFIYMESLLHAVNYKNRIIQYRNDENVLKYLCKCHFSKLCNGQIPYFIDIPVFGEIAFKCDRRIWQAAIFDMFIFNRSLHDDYNNGICLAKIWKWVYNYQKDFEIDAKLKFKLDFDFLHDHPQYAKFGSQSLPYQAISMYLRHLSFIGFIKCDDKLFYNDNYEVNKKSIEVPNVEKGKFSKSIIDKYKDSCIMDIDNIMDKFIYEYGKKSKSCTDNDLTIICGDKNDNEIRSLGYMQVLKLFEKESVNAIVDTYGYRWLFCECCNNIKREDEMSYYIDSMGQCKECTRKYDKVL